MYGSRYGGMGMGSMGLGSYGMSGLGMGGYGGGMLGGGNLYGGYGSSMGMGGYGSSMGMGGYGSSMGMGGYGSSMGMGGYGSSMGMGGYGMNMSGMNGNGTLNNPNSSSNAPAVDANGNPVLAITNGPNGTAPLTKEQEEAQKKAIVEQQRRQRRTFLIEATLQIVTGALQVFLQCVMGLRDIAGILITVYYGYQTLNSFKHSISGREGMAGQAYHTAMGHTPATGVQTATVASPVASSAGASVMRGVKMVIGAAALYTIASSAIVAYKKARSEYIAKEHARLHRAALLDLKMERKRVAKREARLKAKFDRRFSAEAADVSGSESESSCSSCSSTDLDTEDELEYSEPRVRIRHSSQTSGIVEPKPAAIDTPKEKRIYVAQYDHEATGQNGDLVSFRAGDQFEIEDFDGNAWCDALRLGDGSTENRILIPGNYLKPLNLQQKI